MMVPGTATKSGTPLARGAAELAIRMGVTRLVQVLCLIGPLTDHSVGQGFDVQLLTFFTGFHNDIAA